MKKYNLILEMKGLKKVLGEGDTLKMRMNEISNSPPARQKKPFQQITDMLEKQHRTKDVSKGN